ncbi:MAG: DUF3619 family protein [Gallionellaceae bacterium]
MDDKLNPELIRQLLNCSLDRIDQSTLANLRSARLRALSHYEARRGTVPLFAWSDGHEIWHALAHRHRVYYWIGAILLAASLFGGIAYWQQVRDDASIDEEISILTDDLPIQYFVD